MIGRVVFVFGLLGIPLVAGAQTTDAGFGDALSTSMAAVTRAMHGTIGRNLMEAAEAMPTGEYPFKPTPQVRSFAELVGHVVNAQYFFCAMAAGQAPVTTTNHERLGDKPALVAALRASLAYCDGVYEATTDGNVGAALELPGSPAGRRASRGSVLVFNTAHDNEHYGNLVVYLRLRGIVPPSTARIQPSR